MSLTATLILAFMLPIGRDCDFTPVIGFLQSKETLYVFRNSGAITDKQNTARLLTNVKPAFLNRRVAIDANGNILTVTKGGIRLYNIRSGRYSLTAVTRKSNVVSDNGVAWLYEKGRFQTFDRAKSVRFIKGKLPDKIVVDERKQIVAARADKWYRLTGAGWRHMPQGVQACDEMWSSFGNLVGRSESGGRIWLVGPSGSLSIVEGDFRSVVSAHRLPDGRVFIASESDTFEIWIGRRREVFSDATTITEVEVEPTRILIGTRAGNVHVMPL